MFVHFWRSLRRGGTCYKAQMRQGTFSGKVGHTGFHQRQQLPRSIPMHLVAFNFPCSSTQVGDMEPGFRLCIWGVVGTIVETVVETVVELVWVS